MLICLFNHSHILYLVLAQASFGALVLVYLPTILVVHYAFRVTAAYYIAMYVPTKRRLPLPLPLP